MKILLIAVLTITLTTSEYLITIKQIDKPEVPTVNVNVWVPTASKQVIEEMVESYKNEGK